MNDEYLGIDKCDNKLKFDQLLPWINDLHYSQPPEGALQVLTPNYGGQSYYPLNGV